MNCRVVVEAAVPVYDVETPDEAVRIAISKTGEMLNPDLNYVEINMGERSCPHCGEELDPAFIAADESLVALELEMTVFNVERKEHASRIARKEIGQRLSNIPLDVLEIEVLEDDDEDEADEDDEEVVANDEDEADEADEEVAASEDDEGDHEEFDDVEDAEERTEPAEGDDEVLPEFEELIDE
ncbi:MAG: hypothetical protein BRD21_09240 [Halobacteriales archaeon SW_8_66_22]|nr:MAG: hypothetical protein BRD21_09240 [Halobacteriales archaeon SW_8_66_22]